MKPGINKNKFFAINFYIITAVFFVVSIIWMLQHIKYHVLQQHEQLHLFRTGWSYFTEYMAKPGGLLGYIGAFFSQFFFTHWIAASVMGGAIVSIYIIYILVCRKKGNIYPVFSLTMIFPVLLLMCITDPQIEPSYLLGLLTCISFFLFFLQLKENYRYIGGIILIVLAYFLSGGNGLLLGVFIIIDEMFQSKRSWWFIGTILIIMVIVPYCAWLTIYLVPLREAYFSLLPFNLIFPNKIAIITWILFPVFYAIWHRSGHFLSTVLYKWKWVFAGYFFIICVFIGGTRQVVYPRSEHMYHIITEFDRKNWKETIRLSSEYVEKEKNPIAFFYLNMALCESDRMPYDMFQYPQIGVKGLFLDKKPLYFSHLSSGKLYYLLGMGQESERLFFEALEANIEPNAEALRFLSKAALMQKDTVKFTKSIRLLQQSPVHQSWTKRMVHMFENYNRDHVLEKNFFSNPISDEYNINQLLEVDPYNQKAFEYLMAVHLLNKDIGRAKECFDLYFKNFNYSGIPVHYEEALLTYKAQSRLDNSFYQIYSISPTTIQKFQSFTRDFIESEENKMKRSLLMKKYHGTYWLYISF